jgi:gas vesicle protein
MADEYEKDERGSGFVVGLLTGTALGAGLGMLLAPKSGSEIRGHISAGANTVGRTAAENYRKAAGTASNIAEKGRGLYERARDAVSRGTEDVKRYTNQRQGSQKEPHTGSSFESQPGMGEPLPGTRGPGAT